MGATAYFLTWTTYGTWLPGDSRGWIDRHRRHGEIVELPNPDRETAARQSMKQAAVILNARLRETVRQALMETAAHFGWSVHALEVRSNHVHVVVTARDRTAGDVMRIFKAYASRALNQSRSNRDGQWWTRLGSKRNLFTDEDVFSAVRYVRNQDMAWMKGQ
jgi:REP element-mobilizing transposase RayT